MPLPNWYKVTARALLEMLPSVSLVIVAYFMIARAVTRPGEESIVLLAGAFGGFVALGSLCFGGSRADKMDSDFREALAESGYRLIQGAMSLACALMLAQARVEVAKLPDGGEGWDAGLRLVSVFALLNAWGMAAGALFHFWRGVQEWEERAWFRKPAAVAKAPSVAAKLDSTAPAARACQAPSEASESVATVSQPTDTHRGASPMLPDLSERPETTDST